MDCQHQKLQGYPDDMTSERLKTSTQTHTRYEYEHALQIASRSFTLYAHMLIQANKMRATMEIDEVKSWIHVYEKMAKVDDDDDEKKVEKEERMHTYGRG